MRKHTHERYAPEITVNSNGKTAKLVGFWQDLAAYYFDGEYYWSMDLFSGRLTNRGESLKNTRGEDLEGNQLSDSKHAK